MPEPGRRDDHRLRHGGQCREALRRGAADYLQKPYTPEQIRHVVAKVAERRAAEWRLAGLGQELQDAVPEIDLDTRSARMQSALETVARAAVSEAAVLLRGENGPRKSSSLPHSQSGCWLAPASARAWAAMRR